MNSMHAKRDSVKMEHLALTKATDTLAFVHLGKINSQNAINENVLTKLLFIKIHG